MATITINGHAVEAASQQECGTHFVPDASQSNFILIQCQEFLKTDQINTLKSLGISFLSYFAESTYLCRYEPAELEVIRALPFVVYANVYHQDFVVNACLKQKASRVPEPELSGNEDLYSVYVNFHHESATRSTAEMIQLLVEMLPIPSSTIMVDGHRARMSLRATDLPKVALIDDVESIEEFGIPVFANFAARLDLRITKEFPRYPASNFHINQNMYDGNGEIVVVTDSGFDQGIISSTEQVKVHPAFDGRITDLYNIVGCSSKMDMRCHGTCICGSIAANYQSDEFGLIQGTAPKASLIMQSISGPDGRPKSLPIARELTEPYIRYYQTKNARIYSISWASPPKGDPDPELKLEYGTGAKNFDEIMYERKDLLFVIAAGNCGYETYENPALQIANEPAAKNCVTVGACESTKFLTAGFVKPAWDYAAHLWYKYVSEGDAPPKSWPDPTPGDRNNVADFSSKGPVASGLRIKPDVMAPGVDIYTTRSLCNDLSAWPHPKEPESPRDFDYYGNSARDKRCIFTNGTSIAAPLVAGCCAVIRQCLLGSKILSEDDQQNFLVTSALIKAILINGAEDMQDGLHRRGPAVPAAPNSVQGFGRVNQAASLRIITDGQNGGILQSPQRMTQDAPHNIFQKPVTIRRVIDPTAELKIPAILRSATLKATLVYTDPPGPDLVNQLCLKVVAADRSYVYANTGTTTPDKMNNVQKVVWKNLPPQNLTLEVEAKRISPVANNELGVQDFSLAWYVEYSEPSNPKYQKAFRVLKDYTSSTEAARLAMAYGRK